MGRCQHVLQPVVTVRRLLTHPVDLCVIHAAVPVRPKAENIAIKSVFLRAIMHKEPHVNDVCPMAFGAPTLAVADG